MIELIVIAAAASLGALAASVARRTALRRARLRADAMLDELAAAACAHLAAGRDDGRSRRGGRALDRYAEASDRVAAARTRRELDLLVARHRLRTGALRMAERGLRHVRDLLAETVPARR